MTAFLAAFRQASSSGFRVVGGRRAQRTRQHADNRAAKTANHTEEMASRLLRAAPLLVVRSCSPVHGCGALFFGFVRSNLRGPPFRVAAGIHSPAVTYATRRQRLPRKGYSERWRRALGAAPSALPGLPRR